MKGMEGTLVVARYGPALLEWRACGFIDPARVDGAANDASRLLATMPGRVAVFFDASRLDAFAPGTPIRWVRWLSANAPRIDRVAIVARAVPFLTVSRTFPVLIPSVRFSIGTSHDEAAEFLHTADGRVRSGMHAIDGGQARALVPGARRR